MPAKSPTHIGHGPSAALFAISERQTVDQPAPRKSESKKNKPVLIESETMGITFEIYPDKAAGGAKYINLSEEHAIRAAMEYLAIAQRKAKFYTAWLAAMKAGKRKPWKVHV